MVGTACVPTALPELEGGSSSSVEPHFLLCMHHRGVITSFGVLRVLRTHPFPYSAAPTLCRHQNANSVVLIARALAAESCSTCRKEDPYLGVAWLAPGGRDARTTQPVAAPEPAVVNEVTATSPSHGRSPGGLQPKSGGRRRSTRAREPSHRTHGGNGEKRSRPHRSRTGQP